MNKEKYNQIIDEVWKEYGKNHWTPPENPNSKLLAPQLWSVKPMQHNKETFINEIKTNPSFSKKWGLKIDERKLNDDERVKLYENKTNTDTSFFPILRETLTFHNIPTKLITITYKDEKIEIYE